jgi:hypothetical protein
MNTASNDPGSREKRAIENIRQELHRLYRKAFGKEPNPEALRAEAEDFVAKHGPNAGLEDLFGKFPR